MEFKVVIPARYGSRRLSGKPLRTLAGRPLIQHVFERARESGAAEVIVANDDARVADAAEACGARACMTSMKHSSGTGRIAEVAEILHWSPEEIVVNLQGDEPLMDPLLVSRVAHDLDQHPGTDITSLCARIHTSAELFDPHVVKAVLDHQGFALYFSRAPIPWDRDAFSVTTEELPEDSVHYRHIGLYAYRVGMLRDYTALESCYPERSESLEQLRALCNGVRIHCSLVDSVPPHGVDTEEDLQRVENVLSQG